MTTAAAPPGLGSLCHRRLCCSWCCFFAVFLLVAFAASGAGSRSASGRVVTSLPGYEDGPLPFHLETGYVEVDRENGAELFYYFVESESGNDAPFLFWLTGGDRCSVFSGLAYEIGPIRFVLEPYNGSLPRLRYNQNAWSKVSHILFVDSPVGAGFSFSREPKGYDVGDISASLQLYDFLIKWFNDHPEFLANPFYIGGDSYAGKLVPFLAQIISEGIEAGRRTLPNLKGYLVGNPSTGEIIDFSSRIPYAHGFGIISDQLYETILTHCQGQDYTNPINVLCAQALNTFNDLISEVQNAHVLLDTCVYASPLPNIDSRTDGSDGRRILREEMGTGKLNHPPARPPFGCITYGYYLSYFWANDRRTREALGIKEGTKDEWVRCHDKDLPYTGDLGSVIKYHRNLTSRGYRALVYSGDHDLLVPHLGTQAWVRSLNFSTVDDWRAWHLGGQSAGFTISYSNNMTFATIKVRRACGLICWCSSFVFIREHGHY
ncbi:Serine carboxypeptidase-like 19 [Dichanthelium oligosanthes]|uniref:Serine carboxypeptidase-like 19 n=1 Tax=Dichanthelium oligosanthes TaxID=888268 RepID=A0A1E5VMH8_9POAL|nr:Serine carboxypeptidase-like 19 [Dichanthelium oligosanthes]